MKTISLTYNLLALFSIFIFNHAAHGQVSVAGSVELGGQPLAQAEVSLWGVADGKAAKKIGTKRTDALGSFSFTVGSAPEGTVFYLVSRGSLDGGTSVAMLSLLGRQPPEMAMVNELTTVASAFTAAQFISGESISGDPLGLQIAAGNVPNLVNPITGKWGKTLLDPINSTENTTLARLNTLAMMITAYGTVADDKWRTEFLQAASLTAGETPTTTLEAIAGIAGAPWANPEKLYALFDQAYPQPKDGSRRAAPLVPYLAYAPPDFAMILKFAGGGIYSPGKLQIDADGNVWSGQNWMAGSQSGVLNNIGGGTIKLAPDGTALSPPITGFTGMGVDGIGWGTGMSLDKVWIGGLNETIGVMDFYGNPIGNETDFPVAGKIGNLMGVGTAANGDVWIADATKNQLLHFPGGRIDAGKIVNVEGLKSPFGIAIDTQNRVWVSNSQGTDVVRFPADDPAKVETFPVGTAVRGVALDSKGNLWVASNMSVGSPPPVFPAGTPVMKQFQLVLQQLLPLIKKGEISSSSPTGVLSMIRPDGTQPAPQGFNGDKAVFVPWGVSIDGNDDVWFGNFWGRGVGLMAGAEPKGRTEGAQTGDVIHVFQSGSIQMVTDVVTDPAGNAWIANNWNDTDVLDTPDPNRTDSTKGGGSGIVVIYGVAAPTKTPVMGHARAAN